MKPESKIAIYKKSTKKKRLLWRCNVANSILKRAIGIMFKRKFEPLLFLFGWSNYRKEAPIPIHSFFCPHFYAIFVDKYKRIKQIKKMYPSNFFISSPATYLIEVNNIKNIKVGDKLEW
jgi:uncharacterized membrane protein (UPF0127 family)